MSNLIEIQNQINKLQKQASEIKSREFDNTVADIVARMQAFGITLKDLQAAGNRRAKSVRSKGKLVGAAPKRKSVAVAPKYRGPGGETWSGRGLSPRWLSALIAQGRSKEEFVIGG